MWFQDEARIGQQGTVTRVWGERGSRPQVVRQTEYEWVYLFQSVNPLTGENSSLVSPTVNTSAMNEHLKMLRKEASTDAHIVLVLDNAGWHTSKSLELPEHLTLLPLPPYSPELNPVERVWAYMRSHYLSNRVYRDYDELWNETMRASNRLTPTLLQSICRVGWITPAA